MAVVGSARSSFWAVLRESSAPERSADWARQRPRTRCASAMRGLVCRMVSARRLASGTWPLARSFSAERTCACSGGRKVCAEPAGYRLPLLAACVALLPGVESFGAFKLAYGWSSPPPHSRVPVACSHLTCLPALACCPGGGVPAQAARQRVKKAKAQNASVKRMMTDPVKKRAAGEYSRRLDSLKSLRGKRASALEAHCGLQVNHAAEDVIDGRVGVGGAVLNVGRLLVEEVLHTEVEGEVVIVVGEVDVVIVDIGGCG